MDVGLRDHDLYRSAHIREITWRCRKVSMLNGET